MDLNDAVNAFDALSQETRLRICQILTDKGDSGMAAGDISLALGVAQNTLSFHLSHLERAGLIQSRRQGRYIIYSRAPKAVDNLILYLAQTCREQQPD